MEYDALVQRARVTPAAVTSYVNKVYLWMALSLAVTAGAAAYVAGSPEMTLWVLEHWLIMLILLLVAILLMSFGRNFLTVGALGTVFCLFSAVEGATLGPILTLYTTVSVGIAFATSAGMFGAMALYGAVTKRDLSGMGRMLTMLLFGLIIAGVVSCFWGGTMVHFGINVAGVVIFCLFTAYDMQNVIRAGLLVRDEEERSKGAIFGALALYLDFLNLFLYLLRLLGERRD